MARRKRPTSNSSTGKSTGTPSDPRPNHGAVADDASTEPWRGWLLAALAAVFVARHMYPSESAPAAGDDLTMTQLLLVLLGLWLLLGASRRALTVRLGWIDLAVVGLVTWYAAAAVVAVRTASPRPAVNVFWQWVGFAIAFFLVRQFVTGRRELRALLAVMIALATVLAVFGLYQYAYEMPQARQDYFANPDKALRDAGMWFPPGSPERLRFEKRLTATEPMATFALANSLAGVLVPWLVVAAAAGAALGIGRPTGSRHGNAELAEKRTRLRVGGTMAFAVMAMAVCLLLTKSRAGYLAVLLGMAALGWDLGTSRVRRFGWKPIAVIVVILLLLTAIVVASGGLDAPVVFEAQKSLGYRIEYWQATARMIADRPLFGCGPGNFQHAYTEYKLPQASEEVADPHNFLLQLAAEAGLPALLAMLAVLGCFLFRFVSGTKNGESADHGSMVSEDNRLAFRESSGPLPRERPGLIVFGAIAGLPFGWVGGLTSSAPPGGAVVVIGLPLMAAMLWLLWPWIESGRLPSGALIAALAAQLTNLLAAGGIGFSGVALSFWLLLAAGTLMTGTDRSIRLRVWAASVALLAVVFAAWGARLTANQPVTLSRAHLRFAWQIPEETRQALRAAAEADPLAAEPWRQLLVWHFNQWREHPANTDFGAWTRAAEALLQRAPNSAADWLQVADQWMAVYLKTHDQAMLDRAVKTYRTASSLYPNSALHRGRLAVALHHAGRPLPAQQQAQQALQLDAANPHEDKRLSQELRARLLRIAETQYNAHGAGSPAPTTDSP